ncbi:Uncharacterised protein [Legionella cherrii]|uniref:Uncharacterized protein n=1 Tax=Legionella cherrii TaxID=28084 RepID=A0ABY6T617_9GAMM|nr:Uncharacterised protein [Legionella cherrii]
MTSVPEDLLRAEAVPEFGIEHLGWAKSQPSIGQ